jgi:hypothetical protein
VNILPCFFVCFVGQNLKFLCFTQYMFFQILLPTIFTLHLHSFSFWAYVSEEEKHMEMYSPQIIEFYNSNNSGKSRVM